MTSNVELLPLPACPVDYTVSYSRAAMHDYALACVEANTEALRAEVAEWKRQAQYESDVAANAVGHAERLAKAAEKVLVAASARNVLAMFQAAEALGAALHPTAAQENDNA